jgi:hypothetical protein
VLVRVRSSTLEPLIAALPPDLQSQIRGQLTLDQEFTVQLAPAAVTAGAARNVEFPIDVPDAGSAELPTAIGDAVEPPPDTSAGSTAPTSAGAPTLVAGAPVAAVAPASGSFQGVPVWLVVLLVLAAFASSRPLMAVADRLLSARVGAGNCPSGGT